MDIAINNFGDMIQNVFNFAIKKIVLEIKKSFNLKQNPLFSNRYSCNSCSVLNRYNILRNKLFYDLNYNLQHNT